jgi:hypothetical protein
VTDSPRITLLPRLLFWITYLLTLALFFRSEKTFSNLLIFAGLGYLCYYTFNTGVHENHLFLVAILGRCVVLAGGSLAGECGDPVVNEKYQSVPVLRRGWAPTLPRLFAGIDIALPLAVLNVLFFIYLYGAVVAKSLQPLRATRRESGLLQKISRQRPNADEGLR